jgi:methanogenic corrinoid protein MtbC1
MIDIYGELAEPSRRCILTELRAGPKTVTEIVESTGLKQPNVSSHLARMRLRGTVRSAKVGRLVYYTFATPEVESVVTSAFVESPEQQSGTNLSAMAKEYAELAVQGSEGCACKIVCKAATAGYDLLDIYQDLLTPAMQIVGNWWKAGKIDIGQEHLATSITERAMSRIAQMSCPCKMHGDTVVLGCANGAWHTLGLRMIGDYLGTQGWRTIFLGPNVPNEAFLAAVERHRPKMVLISCCAKESAVGTLQLIADLRATTEDLKIGVGGWAVKHLPELFESAEIDFTATDLRSFATEILPHAVANV